MCAVYADHTTLRCTLPAGAGTSQVVRVTLAGLVSSSSVFFAYDGPVISQLVKTTVAHRRRRAPRPSHSRSFRLQPSAPRAQAPTAGNVAITVLGSNFGSNSAGATVTVGATPATVTFRNHSVCVRSRGPTPRAASSRRARRARAGSSSRCPPARARPTSWLSPSPARSRAAQPGLGPLCSQPPRGAQVSNAQVLAYDAPVINAVAPSAGNTQGSRCSAAVFCGVPGADCAAWQAAPR